MPIPSEKQLLDAACHFGHRKEKWNPRIAPYIFGTRRGIHIFDLFKTRENLEKTCDALRKLQKEGKTILFVSTKQQSIAFVKDAGEKLGQPTVTNKWIPGLLTNWPTLKKRIKYYLDLQRSFQTGEVEKYTKKEQLALRKKLAKLDNGLAGVARMTGIPDAVFVIDAILDHVAVKEARKLRVPLYGICDSTADPKDFTICIPANDDAVKSIAIILETVVSELSGEAAKKGVLEGSPHQSPSASSGSGTGQAEESKESHEPEGLKGKLLV